MSDLYVTKNRAKQNSALSGLSDGALNALILAASVAIAQKYTIPGTRFPLNTPGDVQEACIQLMVFLQQEFGVASERLGAWSEARVSSLSRCPAIISVLLRPYKTPNYGPRVITATTPI